MAVYICSQCLFCFERKGPINNCPDCGKPGIRDATEKEAAEFRQNKAMYSSDKPNPLFDEDIHRR